MQKCGIDTIVARKNKPVLLIEEKIQAKKWDCLCLETQSCTILGLESQGWMHYSRADLLFYCFVSEYLGQQPVSLDAYLIPFPQLKRWFWNELNESTKTALKWRTVRTQECNRSESELVPIIDIQNNVKGVNHYELTIPNGQYITVP